MSGELVKSQEPLNIAQGIRAGLSPRDEPDASVTGDDNGVSEEGMEAAYNELVNDRVLARLNYKVKRN